ncbi:RagB/SusD family nutrient uptake outer membrane protein [Pedobacter sp. AW31-3R]|uniref:RagB/SusD family nutrient uptake outer membrane protein n=1 Tax=Pedobacter sp. AW31-3R TaxID=3445781 RepID=UPI003FA027D1
MKNIKLYFTSVMLIMILGSCEKYLDVNSNNTQVPITTVEQCQQLLNDDDVLNNNYPGDGLISGEEFYVSDLQLNAGIVSGVIDLNARNLYTWDASAFGDEWQSSYAKVNRANIILESLEKIEKKGGSDATELNNVRGQALFFRAYSFWQLAQLYTKPYNVATALQDLGIPLHLTADVNEKSVRGSVQQTYDRILLDLNAAIPLLAPDFFVPTRPTKAAAYAMLARVYLGIEDYAKALTNATEALNLNSQLMNFNDLDGNSGNPIPRYNQEMIFSAVSTGAGVALLRPNEYAKINQDLIDLYGTNDLRKEVFFSQNTEDNSYYFTGNYAANTSASFFTGLAVDEVLLTRAECYARTGNVGDAMVDLNKLLVSRWNTNEGTTPYIPISAVDANDALGKVTLERRKELVFRSMRWTDLRRLNKETLFAKTLTRTVSGMNYTLPPNDLRYTLLIKRDAVNYGGIEQNQR